ncbi:hypothetical protein JAAARDRAFT_40281, partial [Jaapia argillacea MUCL 33604]
MSTPKSAVPTSVMEQDRPPHHHMHHSGDPLPGNHGVPKADDYSTEATENWGAHAPTGVPRTKSAKGETEVDEDRPLNTQPVSGGVAVDGKEDLPEGKASFADKMVGKTQKLIGKVSTNPEMHEKGELRESGGKAAVQGGARAAH